MLDSTIDSVKSALKRARASLQDRRPTTDDREPPPASGSPSEDVMVANRDRCPMTSFGTVDVRGSETPLEVLVQLPPAHQDASRSDSPRMISTGQGA